MKIPHLKAISISTLALLITFVMTATLILKVKSYHIATIKSDNEIVVDKLLYAIKFKIEAHISALKLTERFFQSSDHITRDEFHNFAIGVLNLYPEIKALEWLPIITDDQRANFELSVQQQGFADFKITQKDETGNMVPAAKREFYTPIYYVEPYVGNEPAFGLDSRANASAKKAIEIATETKQTSMSAPTILVQEHEQQNAILIYQPHYSNNKLQGFVLLILRMDSFIESLNVYNTFGHEFEYQLSDIDDNGSILSQSVAKFSTGSQWYTINQNFKIANRTWNVAGNFNLETDAGYQQGKFWSWAFTFLGVLIACLVAVLIYLRIKFSESTKKSALEFSSEEKRYQTLLKSSADAYFLQDMDGYLLDVNDAACEAMGYSRKELLNMNVMEVNVMIEGATKKDYLDYFKKFPKNKTVHRELIYRKKDGTHFPVELSMNKFTYRNKDVLSGFIRDISDRKEYENSLKQARRTAEQANSAKSEFLTKMSHEFRTPMHSILSFSDMGLKRLHKVPLQKLESYFNNIQKSGNRLMRLLNNLLDLAKLETGKLKYCFEKRSLSLILDDCLLEQKLQLKQKNITLDIQNHAISDHIVCDVDKIQQVIINLVANAIKFTKPDSCIHIAIDKDNEVLETEGLLFCICDEGEGIPESELKDIFDKFVQSSKVTSDQEGTGLGLAICSEIIEGHMGKIWAENVSCGASLKFVIPLTPNEG